MEMNLLYPEGIDRIYKLSEEAYKDLAIEEILEGMFITKEDRDIVRKAFFNIPMDLSTIKYRQDISDMLPPLSISCLKWGLLTQCL